MPRLALVVLLVSTVSIGGGLVADTALADETPFPEIVGEGVDPFNHGYWPVRVRSLDQIRWTFEEGEQVGFAAPLGAGLLFIQAGGGGIRGVEAGSGKRWWLAPGQMDRWNYSSCVLGPGGIAYGGNFNWVRAVTRQGKLRWKVELQAGWLHAAPAVSPDGKTVYVSGDRLGIASLDAATGHVNWLRRDFHGSWHASVFDTEGNFIVSTNGAVLAFGPNGAPLWRAAEPLRNLMVIGDLLVGSNGGELKALDLRTQGWVWKLQLGQTIQGLARLDDGRFVASLMSGELATVTPAGRLRWRRQISPTALLRPSAVQGGETLVADANGRLYLCSASGRVVSQIDTGDQPRGWRPTVSRDGLVYVSHRSRVVCVTGQVRPPPEPVVASEMLVVADDFVVDVWVNGEKLDLAARELLGEIHGASHERVLADLQEGDWVVFHVVANRLRWGGASYFGVQALAPDGSTAFTSVTDGPWWACDDPGRAAAFIASAEAGQGQPVVAPAKPWHDAERVWGGLLDGRAFEGEPVWGEAPSTWIKVVVQRPLPADVVETGVHDLEEGVWHDPEPAPPPPPPRVPDSSGGPPPPPPPPHDPPPDKR